MKRIIWIWVNLSCYFLGENGEPEINQETCRSDDKNLDLSAPKKSGKNHMAKCGFVNIFSYAKSDCTIREPTLQQC